MLSKRTILVSAVMACVALAAFPQDRREPGPQQHFARMFEEMVHRAEEDLRRLGEEMRMPELSEGERQAVETLREAHMQIAERSREALEAVRGPKAQEPPALEELERSIRADEMRLEVLRLERERQSLLRILEGIADNRTKNTFSRQVKTLFDDLVRAAEQQIERRLQLWDLRSEIDAAMREAQEAQER